MIRRLFALPNRISDAPLEAERVASLAEAYAFCEHIAEARWSDWPLFARFVPSPILPGLAAICAFVRYADELCTAVPEPARQAAFNGWEDQLVRAWHGEADHPVFVALADAAAARELPITPLLELLTALRMDVPERRYATMEGLVGYLNCAAVPLGRLLLHLFGQHDPVRDRYAADFSTALLLTHLLADVRDDARRGFVYLPQQDLAHFEVGEASLVAPVWSASVRNLMAFEAARARSLFLRGRPLLESVDGPLADIAVVLWRRGLALLARIELEGDTHAAQLALATPELRA